MNGEPFSVIASVSEATQLAKHIKVQFNRSILSVIISWVASRSFAMTGGDVTPQSPLIQLQFILGVLLAASGLDNSASYLSSIGGNGSGIDQFIANLRRFDV